MFLPIVGEVSPRFCDDLARWKELHDHGGKGRDFRAEMRKTLAQYLSRRLGRRVTPSQALQIARAAYSKTQKAA